IGKTFQKETINPIYAAVLARVGRSVFRGYETTQVGDAKITAIFGEDKQIDELKSGEQGSIVLDQTPFYAEAGGQVGDTGVLVRTAFGKTGDDNGGMMKMGGVAAKATVSDTYSPVSGLIIHKVTLASGSLKVGDEVVATVDSEKRDATRRNHTATHL